MNRTSVLEQRARRRKAAELRQRLRSMARGGKRVKAAALGGDPEQSFEQAFASLAYTYIRDKAPKLLDYMIGFQLVERNEDNTRAVGIFGFKPGDQWMYGPVFFLSGDLKGHELLYLKNQDQFVPMKENWINKLLNRRPRILGEPTHKNLQQLGIRQPDIRTLSIPPYYSKFGSAQVKIPAGWPDWMVEAAPALGDWATGSVREKFAGLDERLSLPKLLSESLALTKLAMATCRAYPEVGRLCRAYYGEDFLKQALLELRAKAVAAAKPRILGELAGRPKQAAGPPVEIRVREDAVITQNTPDLSDEEREKLLRDGVLIRDRRRGEEVSKAYDTQVKMELVNPDASGVYDVLVRPQGFKECLVINNPKTAKGSCDFATVVRFEDDNSWLNVHASRLYVRPDKRTREEQAQWLDGRSSSDIRVDGTYIVVCRSKAGTLEGSAPFTVREDLGDGRYRVTWHDTADRARPTYLRLGGSQWPSSTVLAGNYEQDIDLHSRGDIIWFNERKGSRFKGVQGALMVPPEAKVLAIAEPYREPYEDYKPEGKRYEGPCERSVTDPINPGDIADVQMEILQKTASLKLWADEHDVSINSGPRQSRKSALISLVKEYGFREKTARHLIREAALNCRKGKPAFFRVKYAQGYPMIDPGPSAPAIPPQEVAVNEAYGNVPATYLQTESLDIPELSAANTDPQIYDMRPEALPDPMAMQVAQQAGQLGQKEVFDTAMISGLLKAVRQDSLVDRYVGDLMKALDRLGRILFQFYWHNDAFMDRYGKSDMPELEDTLRNAFEVLGDLILFLREKDVEPLGNLDLQSPTVEDTAE